MCCNLSPIDKDVWERNKHKAVRPYKEELEASEPFDAVFPITDDLKCCFLGHDLKCAIYDDRPRLCRKYGDESVLSMTCPYQAKDGKIRSRQETRKILRMLGKHYE